MSDGNKSRPERTIRPKGKSGRRNQGRAKRNLFYMRKRLKAASGASIWAAASYCEMTLEKYHRAMRLIPEDAFWPALRKSFARNSAKAGKSA